jgi:hypothetical protein
MGRSGLRTFDADTKACGRSPPRRILYGADGARFLDRIRNLLSEPLGLAL